MNKKNMMIGVVSAVVLIALIIIIILVIKGRKPNLEKELSNLAVDYYENTFKEIYPDFLDKYGELIITLDTLKDTDADLSLFEKNDCNGSDTYVTLKQKDGSSYDIEVTLACKEQ